MSLNTIARACIAFAREALRGHHDPFFAGALARNAAENALAGGDAVRAIECAREAVGLARGDMSTAYRLCTEALINARAAVKAQEQLAALRTLPERKARYAERIDAARAAREG